MVVLWIKLDDGREGSAVGDSIFGIQQELGAKVVEHQILPYPSSPVLTAHGRDWAFCWKGKACAGKRACPMSRACSE